MTAQPQPHDNGVGSSTSGQNRSSGSSATWTPRDQQCIKTIADTDELPDGMEWTELRKGIKLRISEVLQSFPEAPAPWLHPAARVAGPSQPAHPAASPTSSSSSASSSSSSSPSTAAAAAGLNNRFASAGVNGSTRADRSQEDQRVDGDGDDDLQWVNQDGQPVGSEMANLNSLSSNSITDADRSGFFPAKSRPPPQNNGSWGRRLTREDVDSEKELVFAMLDDFESSPPFTIQRLAELLLQPRMYARSAPKFLSSLVRVLSVTASHQDFPPVSPGVAPGAMGAMTGPASAPMQPGMAGPPSPNAEPIFSPIPFLQKRQEYTDSSGDESVPPFNLAASNSNDNNISDENGHAPAHPMGSDVQAPPPVSLEETFSERPEQQQQPNSAMSIAQRPEADAAGASSGLPAQGSSEPVFSSSTSLQQPLGVPHGRVDELDDYGQESHDGGFSTGATGGDNATNGMQHATSTTAAGSTGGVLAPEHGMDGNMRPLSSTTTTPSSSGVDGLNARRSHGLGHGHGDSDEQHSGQQTSGGQGTTANREDEDATMRQAKRIRSDDGAGSEQPDVSRAQRGIERAGQEAEALESREQQQQQQQ